MGSSLQVIHQNSPPITEGMLFVQMKWFFKAIENLCHIIIWVWDVGSVDGFLLSLVIMNSQRLRQPASSRLRGYCSRHLPEIQQREMSMQKGVVIGPLLRHSSMIYYDSDFLYKVITLTIVVGVFYAFLILMLSMLNQTTFIRSKNVSICDAYEAI